MKLLSRDWLKAQLFELGCFPKDRVTVAYSGGADSTALLHLLHSLTKDGFPLELSAIHVHHGMSPNADKWVHHCQQFCDALTIPLTVVRVEVTTRRTGIERAAREARYAAFEQAIDDGSLLFQGHHQDDQAETVLLRLFRGTGLDGLAAIPRRRPLGQGQLLRPLLSCSRKSIEHYCQHHQLAFIFDDSNLDMRFARNFIRQQLMPMIDQRWPEVAERLGALADEAAAFAQQHQDDTSQLLATCLETHPEWLLGKTLLLNIDALNKFPMATRQQILRAWLKHNELEMPSREQLQRIFIELIQASPDSNPQMRMDNHILRRHANCLMLSKLKTPEAPPMEVNWDWRLSKNLVLNMGTLTLEPANQGPQVFFPDDELTIRWRHHLDPEYKFAIAGREGRKTLRRWFQEYKVPTWLRDEVPLVFHKEQLICAPGLWIAEGFQWETGQRAVWEFAGL